MGPPVSGWAGGPGGGGGVTCGLPQIPRPLHTKIIIPPPPGGGGVLRFGSDGDVPLKRVPIMAEKGTHYLLGFFIQENYVFVYTLATKWAKLQNYTPCLGIFSAKPAMLRVFLRKSHPFERHTPVYLIRRVPPPPPGFETPN